MDFHFLLFISATLMILTGCQGYQYQGSPLVVSKGEHSKQIQDTNKKDANKEDESEEQNVVEVYHEFFDWHDKHQDSFQWSVWAYEAISEFENTLLVNIPTDIKSFCLNYPNLDVEKRKIFWISLLAAITRFESFFDPKVEYKENFKDRHGEYIISRGLLQLSIESALGYRCELDEAEQLHDPKINLSCATKIINRWIERDGVISAKPNKSWRGAARYWSTLRRQKSLNKIKDKTAEMPVCQL